MFESSINPMIMSKSKIASLLFVGITMFMFSSCGKSYKSSENSIPIDIYLSGPMGLSEEEIEKNDSLAILLNLIDGRMPQMNFHRLDLGDSVFRDTIEMGFFNSLFEEFIDVNDMKEDLMNKEFGDDLKAFLTAPKGNNQIELDSKKTCLAINSLLQCKDESQKAILEKNLIENTKGNNGRILISIYSSKLTQGNDSITAPNEVGLTPTEKSKQKDPKNNKDSDGDGVIDENDNCKDEFGSKEDGGCPGIGRLAISNGGAVSWSGATKVLYLSIRYSTARDKEIIPTIKVENGDKIKIPGVQNTNDQQYYIIKYGRSKGNLASEITVKCTNFL